MRVAIVCNDTRGGIQPYLGLSQGLRVAGHQPLMVAPTNYRGWIESMGIEFAGIEGDVQKMVQDPKIAAAIEKGFWASQKIVIEMLKKAILDWTRDCLTACRGADLILSGFGGMIIAESVAEKLGSPFVQAHLQPLTPTSKYPGVLSIPGAPQENGFLNRLSHFISRQVFWQPMRGAVNAARDQVLGLPPTRFWSNIGLTRPNREPILYGYSPSLLPRPKDWPGNIHVTGYWFLGADQSWTPPAGLVDFLDSGSTPISVGFGSMSSQKAEATTHLLLDAVKRSGQRVVLLSGWSGMKPADLPSWAYPIDAVPHEWLFARTSLAVHHGGAGTTGAALRAGIPSVIVPHGADQPFWGKLLSSQGLGTTLGSRKKMTAEKLAEAISSTLANRPVIERSAEMGRLIRSEDGVGRAVTLLESTMKTRRTVS